MKNIQLKYLLLATITTYLFMGCVGEERVTSLQSLEHSKQNKVEEKIAEKKGPPAPHTQEMEQFLSNVPIGSEIYLEEKKDGAWYLKVEKTFTSKTSEEEHPNTIIPISTESILI